MIFTLHTFSLELLVIVLHESKRVSLGFEGKKRKRIFLNSELVYLKESYSP